MKKLIALLLTALMLLPLIACSSAKEAEAPVAVVTEAPVEPTEAPTPEPAADLSEENIKKLLTSETWKEVVTGNEMSLQFIGDGTGILSIPVTTTINGVTSTTMSKVDCNWKLEDTVLVLTYTFYGDKESRMSFVFENGIYTIQGENRATVYARTSDYSTANSLYYVEKPADADPTPRPIAYYEECPDLPTADSLLDILQSGKSTTKSNGKVTKILYRYNATGDTLKRYTDALEENGVKIEKISDLECNIIIKKYIVATVVLNGLSLEVSIVPEDQREMSASDAKPISIGQTIKTNDYEFTLNNIELTYELKPKNTSSFYTSYPAESGKVYIHIDGTYLNTSKRDICIRDLFVPKAEYDDGYKYDGFVVIDDGDTRFDWVSSYVACTPLTSCHYHGLIECPEIVDTSTKPLFVLLTMADGITYRYDIR